MESSTVLFTLPGAEEMEGNLLVFPNLFREAMNLIFDSYEYFELHDQLDQENVPPHIQTLMSNEMSRVTMRLTSVMAWLMARKAVLAGHLTDEEVREQYRVEGEEYCLQHFEELAKMLPAYMIELLEKSHALYQRIWRLDQMLDQPGLFD